jgi:hypothetical protein
VCPRSPLRDMLVDEGDGLWRAWSMSVNMRDVCVEHYALSEVCLIF